jgi:hypothetical protein
VLAILGVGALTASFASAEAESNRAASDLKVPLPRSGDDTNEAVDRAVAGATGKARPIQEGRALRAINRELSEQAYMRQNIAGFPFYWQRGDCWYVSRKAIQCDAFIIQDMGYECEFAGYEGRRYSADGAWVIARKLRGSRRVATGFGYTFDYYYCYS